MTYDWDLIKPEICESYVIRKQRLVQVARAIRERYGFDIQIRTYREKLREWKYRRVDQRSLGRGRVSDGTHSSCSAPRRDSLLLRGTKSVYKPDPTTSCTKILVIRTSRSRHGTAGRLHNGSSSPIPQSGASELKLTRQALIRNTKTARQTEKAGAELMDGVESSEDDLALTDNRQPIRPQLITESMVTQIRPNDPVVIQGRQTDYIDEILRVHTQTIRSLAVAGPMVHRTLESTASLLQTSTRKECYFSKKDCEPGRCLQLQHTTSIYANCSLPCAMCVPAPSYPSAFPEQEVSHIEPQDAPPLHGESPDFAPIETCFNTTSYPTENAGAFSHPGPFQATGNDPLQLPINHPETEESFGMMQPVVPAPQAGSHSPPLQTASDSTNEVGRTCSTLWDGSEFFNFDFEEANTGP